MALIFAVGNRKGGVGKTTVTLNLAQAFALMRLKVLVIDLDSQMNATQTLEAVGEFNVFDVLYGGGVGTLADAIVQTSWSGIDMVPGSRDLARIESESLMSAEMRLKNAAYGAEGLEEYDIVLIDLPPALGRLTLNGLVFADLAIAVTEPQAYSVEGLSDYLDVIQKVKSIPTLNPSLRFAGIIVNKLTTAPMTSEHKFQLDEMRAAYGDVMLEPFVPARTAVQDSSSSHTPLTRIAGPGAMEVSERFIALARKLKEMV